MHLPVTLLYGGISVLLVAGLGLWVSAIRLRTGTYVGKELPKELIRPIRAHGNAAEWVPLAILLLALLELSGVGSTPLHLLGGTFVLARALHAFGVLGRNRSTLAGATLNYGVVLVMAGWAVALHFVPVR